MPDPQCVHCHKLLPDEVQSEVWKVYLELYQKERCEVKVEVLTVEEVKIHRWRWWSNWIDIAVFNYQCQPFLIQMRISRTNAKSFRSVSTNGFIYRQCTCDEIGDLTQMKGGAK